MTASERPCYKDRDRAFGWLAPLHLYPLLTIIMGSNFGQWTMVSQITQREMENNVLAVKPSMLGRSHLWNI